MKVPGFCFSPLSSSSSQCAGDVETTQKILLQLSNLQNCITNQRSDGVSLITFFFFWQDSIQANFVIAKLCIPVLSLVVYMTAVADVL